MSSVTSLSSFTDHIRDTGTDWEDVATHWKHWRSNHGIPKSTSSGRRRLQKYAEQNCRQMNHPQWELGCSQLWNRETVANDWFWSNLVGREKVDVYLGKDRVTMAHPLYIILPSFLLSLGSLRSFCTWLYFRLYLQNIIQGPTFHTMH